MTHPNDERLNDLVDGLLPEIERQEVESHLRECADCARTVEELRQLVAGAAALGERAPGRDLFPEIRTAVSPPSRPWLRWGAAAAAVAAVAVLGAWRFGGGETAEPPKVETLLAEFRAAETEYIRAAEMLSAGLAERRDELAPETVAVLDKNLAVIDSAIEEVQAVLERDGIDVESTHLLATLYDKKIDVLLRASRLSSKRGLS